MIKTVTFTNWKSFRDATLYIDPLTVLIGANASGKSNALDALLFLQRTASGRDFLTALAGDAVLKGIRGGVEWAPMKPGSRFGLSVTIEGRDERTEYVYSLEVETVPRPQLFSEVLQRVKYHPRSKGNPYRIQLIRTDAVEVESPSITARLYNEKHGTKKELHRSTTILSQLSNLGLRKEIAVGISQVLSALQSIFILDPIPHHMRNYTPLSDVLHADGSNIAGLLAALPPRRKEEMESTLTEYAKHLPEGDIRKVWSEPVGRLQTDAMLYCEEQWIPRQKPTPIDARGMSDGTLRFLAILTALLTRPEKSLLVIEEVDNGLHPSRSDLLVRMLREVGGRRGVDVLVTTHNPALLDALGPEMLPFIVVAHRNLKQGESALTLLEDIERLPKLLASGSIGRLSSKGAIQRALTAGGGSSRA